MLVLTRRANESIIVGNDGGIVIKVLETKKSYARIGIEAPKSIAVHRNEVHERIQQEKHVSHKQHAMNDAQLIGHSETSLEEGT